MCIQGDIAGYLMCIQGDIAGYLICIQNECQHLCLFFSSSWASLVAQTVKDLPAMWETQVWEDPLEKGILQYSCLENSIDRGAWQTIVHRVAKNQTRLRDTNTRTLKVLKLRCLLCL